MLLARSARSAPIASMPFASMPFASLFTRLTAPTCRPTCRRGAHASSLTQAHAWLRTSEVLTLLLGVQDRCRPGGVPAIGVAEMEQGSRECAERFVTGGAPSEVDAGVRVTRRRQCGASWSAGNFVGGETLQPWSDGARVPPATARESRRRRSPTDLVGEIHTVDSGRQQSELRTTDGQARVVGYDGRAPLIYRQQAYPVVPWSDLTLSAPRDQLPACTASNRRTAHGLPSGAAAMCVG